MQEYTYPIEKFSFFRLTNTFFAEEKNLLANVHNGFFTHNCIFPNKRTQFFIESKKQSKVITYIRRDRMIMKEFVDEINWFRRFRLKKENAEFYTFESEDGILCKIQKDKENETI